MAARKKKSTSGNLPALPTQARLPAFAQAGNMEAFINRTKANVIRGFENNIVKVDHNKCVFSIDGKEHGEELDVVIFDAMFLRHLYDPKTVYSEEAKGSPICFAYAKTLFADEFQESEVNEMRPHEKVKEAQCDVCAECYYQQPKTNARKTGPACTQHYRVAFTTVDDVGKSNPRIFTIELNVFSYGAFGNYIAKLLDNGVLPWCVTTRMVIAEKRDKNSYVVAFETVNTLAGALQEKALELIMPSNDQLKMPYIYKEIQSTPKRGGKKKAAKKKSKKKIPSIY